MSAPVVWITGRPRSGKTTLGRALQPLISGLVLDGDELRRTVNKGLGFTKDDRLTATIRAANLAHSIAVHGMPAIVAMVSPYEQHRLLARAGVDKFFLIHVDTPLEACMRADEKGVYKNQDASYYESPSMTNMVYDRTQTAAGPFALRVAEALKEWL